MAKPQRLELYNDVHHTKAVVLVPPSGNLSIYQIRNAAKQLCGKRDCLCSGPLGTRSAYTPRIEWEHDARNGRLIGAHLPAFDQTQWGK